MPRFTSKGSVSVEAHVVSEDEGELRATTAPGLQEVLKQGDALVTLNRKQYRVPAQLFAALFTEGEGEAAEPTRGKGGQQESRTEGASRPPKS